MTIEQNMLRGNRAKEVLENEVFQESFAQIEQEIFEKWKTSPARDEEGRQKLWLFQQMLNRVREVLTTTMESGKLASLELEHKRTLAERARDIWQGQ